MNRIFLLLLLLAAGRLPAQLTIVPQVSSQNYVTTSVYNPQQQLIAMAEYRVPRLAFWDARSGLKVHTLTLSAPVVDLAVSPDGNYFVACSENGQVSVIGSGDLEVQRSFDAALHAGAYGVVIMERMPVVFTGPGEFVFARYTGSLDLPQGAGSAPVTKAGRSDKSVQLSLYSIPLRRESAIGTVDKLPMGLSWDAASGQLVAVGEQGIARMQLGSRLWTPFVNDSLSAGRFNDPRFAWSDDRAWLSVINKEHVLQLFDTRSGKRRRSVRDVFSCAFIGRDSLLYQARDRSLHLLSVKTGASSAFPGFSGPQPWSYAWYDYGPGVRGAMTPAGPVTYQLLSGTVSEPVFSQVSPPFGTALADNGVLVYGQGSGLYEFRTRFASFGRKIATLPRPVYATLLLETSDRILVQTRASGVPDSVYCLRYSSGALLWKAGFGEEGERISGLSANRTGSKLLVACGPNILAELNLADGALLHRMKTQQRVFNVRFANDASDTYLALAELGPQQYGIVRTGPGLQPVVYEQFGSNLPIRSFALSRNGAYACYSYPEDGRFYVKLLQKSMPPQTIAANARVFAFSPKDEWLAAGTFSNGTVRLYRFPELTPWAEVRCGNGKVHELEFSTDGRFLFAVLEDGWVSVIDVQKKTEAARLTFDEANYIATTPAGYYAASKGQVAAIGIRTANRCFPVSNADLKFNRPDLLMQAMGQSNQSVLDVYRRAYRKRLRRLGVDEGEVSLIEGFPQAVVRNAQLLKASVRERFIDLPLRFESEFGPLHAVSVLVNGVPLYGASGLPLGNRRLTRLDTVLRVPLLQGRNEIEVEAVLANGVRSTRGKVRVQAQYPAAAPKLYFVGIGIDHFRQPGHDLRWSVKDIRDLAGQLRSKLGADLVIDTLLNEQVTPAAVAALRRKLAASSVNDRVIVAYSGHGLLSGDFDYFLSAYDVDFRNPAQGGLPYEALEGLLDSIPARRKLMLIDACHSGEVDKEDLQAYAGTGGSDSLAKGVGVPVASTDRRVGTHNSFELMQQLFVNVGRCTGATVISAAAGTQFALERGDLRNGVFTWALLEFLRAQPAPSVDALRRWVNRRVPELTRGLQVPTAREENDRMDWVLWQEGGR